MASAVERSLRGLTSHPVPGHALYLYLQTNSAFIFTDLIHMLCNIDQINKICLYSRQKCLQNTHFQPLFEKGYEASEEGSADERSETNPIRPLFYFSLSQPNAYYSQLQFGTKFQISFFDISTKINSEFHRIQSIPCSEDFPISLLETKSGEPHQDTGVLPAFLTIKLTKDIGNIATLDVEIGKPTRVLVSLERWNTVMEIQRKLVQNLSINTANKRSNAEEVVKIDKKESKASKSGESYAKFKQIKSTLNGIGIINVRLAQLVLTVNTDENVELNLSLGKLTNVLTISNRPERLSNVCGIDCLTLGIRSEEYTKLLLNPWSFSVEVSILLIQLIYLLKSSAY